MEGYRPLCVMVEQNVHMDRQVSMLGHVCPTVNVSLKIIPMPHVKNGSNT